MASEAPRRSHGNLSSGSTRRGRGDTGRRGRRGEPRTRASLSLDQIIEAAIITLDAVGSEKMTLRGLAAQLDSGVASLYWYASGKDQLMAIVADELVGQALDETAELERAGQPHPKQFEKYPALKLDERTNAAAAEGLLQIRRLVLCLYVQMLDHRWLASQLIKAGPDELNSLSHWEMVGQALQKMELDLSTQLHASMVVASYASGVGAEVSQRAIERAAMDDTEARYNAQISHWASYSEEEFPFVHSVLGEFQNLDEGSEFVMGLDLVLSGLERLTWD